MACVAEPTVTVRGEGSREGPPELAGFEVTSYASAGTAQAVRAQLAEASQAVAALLAAHAAALESSHTAGLHVTPVFGRRAGKITGYQGSFSSQLVVHDLDALPAIVLAATAVPNCQVSGPWWSLRPSSPLYRAARLAAIEDARRRAEDYAAAFGLQVGALVEISDLEAGARVGPEAFALRSAFGADNAEPEFDFQPATQTVSGQVTVRFALTG